MLPSSVVRRVSWWFAASCTKVETRILTILLKNRSAINSMHMTSTPEGDPGPGGSFTAVAVATSNVQVQAFPGAVSRAIAV
mmetsp:Transcript_7585/g.22891  ORF Transcript_7585/g.22891 Transcript_7585/m.22891 type:complete len:81 (-) Transcript_7585:117-359(-)